MTMITRYIFFEYFRVFLLTSISLALVVFSIDTLETMRSIYKYDPSFTSAITYFLFRLPKMVFELMPLSVLLSSLITFGGLSKNNEITAFKSAGVSIYRLATPILIFGFVLSLFAVYMTGGLVPTLLKRSQYIRIVEIDKRQPPGSFVQNKSWLHLDNRRLIYVNLVSVDQKRLQGVHLYTLDDDFTLIEDHEADELIYEGDLEDGITDAQRKGRWVFLNGVHRRFFPDGTTEVTPFERKRIKLNKQPKDFQNVAIKTSQSTAAELRHYIQRLKDDGFDATRYQVDLRAKEALSFANMIMILLGIPFALKDSRSAGIAWGVAISLGVALLYWIVFSMGLSLGRLMIFPPWIAAWSANFLFMIIGAYLFLNIRQ